MSENWQFPKNRILFQKIEKWNEQNCVRKLNSVVLSVNSYITVQYILMFYESAVRAKWNRSLGPSPSSLTFNLTISSDLSIPAYKLKENKESYIIYADRNDMIAYDKLVVVSLIRQVMYEIVPITSFTKSYLLIKFHTVNILLLLQRINTKY